MYSTLSNPSKNSGHLSLGWVSRVRSPSCVFHTSWMGGRYCCPWLHGAKTSRVSAFEPILDSVWCVSSFSWFQLISFPCNKLSQEVAFSEFFQSSIKLSKLKVVLEKPQTCSWCQKWEQLCGDYSSRLGSCTNSEWWHSPSTDPLLILFITLPDSDIHSPSLLPHWVPSSASKFKTHTISSGKTMAPL